MWQESNSAKRSVGEVYLRCELQNKSSTALMLEMSLYVSDIGCSSSLACRKMFKLYQRLEETGAAIFGRLAIQRDYFING